MWKLSRWEIVALCRSIIHSNDPIVRCYGYVLTFIALVLYGCFKLIDVMVMTPLNLIKEWCLSRSFHKFYGYPVTADISCSFGMAAIVWFLSALLETIYQAVFSPIAIILYLLASHKERRVNIAGLWQFLALLGFISFMIAWKYKPECTFEKENCIAYETAISVMKLIISIMSLGLKIAEAVEVKYAKRDFRAIDYVFGRIWVGIACVPVIMEVVWISSGSHVAAIWISQHMNTTLTMSIILWLSELHKSRKRKLINIPWLILAFCYGGVNTAAIINQNPIMSSEIICAAVFAASYMIFMAEVNLQIRDTAYWVMKLGGKSQEGKQRNKHSEVKTN